MSDSTSLQFTFIAHVLFDPTIADGYMKHFVPLPDEVADAFAASGITYVEGTLNGVAYRRVIHNRPDGIRCLKFGKTWLELAQLDIDAEIMVEMMPDPDPSRVDVPDELAVLFADDPAAEHIWQSLSVSKRKTMAYDITRAKRRETRERRARAVIATLHKNH